MKKSKVETIRLIGDKEDNDLYLFCEQTVHRKAMEFGQGTTQCKADCQFGVRG